MTTSQRQLVSACQPENAGRDAGDPPVFRMEVRPATSVAIAERPVFGCQFTLSSHWPVATEFLLEPHHILGWLDHHRLAHLRITPHYPTDVHHSTLVSSVFSADNNVLRARKPLRIFLLSHDIDVIRQQGACLFSQSPGDRR